MAGKAGTAIDAGTFRSLGSAVGPCSPPGACGTLQPLDPLETTPTLAPQSSRQGST